MRKVAAQEIFGLQSLKKVYTHSPRVGEHFLRIFHVQNADWATGFLLQKFNLINHGNPARSNFGRYITYRRPERRGGKPFLGARSWSMQRDPWRGVSMTSFGLDYLRPYPASAPGEAVQDKDLSLKFADFNEFDEFDNPRRGPDIYVQRVSCYIQHRTGSRLPPDLDPSDSETNPHARIPGKTPSQFINSFDNGNAVLIFDNSHTSHIADSLIAARGDWESRWRRLPFILVADGYCIEDSDDLASLLCMRAVIEDVFEAVINQWDVFMDVARSHVDILQEKTYEQPADETKAPELWLNSAAWLKVEKLLILHSQVSKEISHFCQVMTSMSRPSLSN